jgi:serine/threonine protein kinase
MDDALLGGRYRLGEELGKGGMARVVRAFDTRLSRDCAVKILSSELRADPAYVARFRAEAVLSAKVSHPCLVEVIDVGVSESGDVYLVMELLDGVQLGSVIDEGGMALERFFPVARGVLEGLRALHAAGIVHRDVTARNVMLVRGALGEERVKVLDLGIAKATGQKTLTEPGTFVGTLQSMAPEQIRGEPVDARADVYSVGVLFFRMLSGHLPFEGDATSLMYQHLEARPPPVESTMRVVPAPLVRLVASCLEKEPSARPPSAEALLHALSRIERGESEPEPPLPASVDVANVPDLALPLPPTRTEASPAGLRAEMVLEPEASSSNPPLELVEVDRKRETAIEVAAAPCATCGAKLAPNAVVCASCGARASAITPFRGPNVVLGPRVPAWLAPVGILPVSIGKRVATYSFGAAVLAALAGGTSGVLPITFFVVSVVATVGVVVRQHLDDAV